MLRHPGGRPSDPRRVRLFALLGAVACAVVLPLAVASAGQVGDGGRPPVRDVLSPSARADAAAPSAAPTTAPLPFAPGAGAGAGAGSATAARCGPELTSPDGVEAQTCVLTQGEESWARTYYRNATGAALDAALSLMGPGGRSVVMRCAVAAEDDPGSCETPRERTRGDLGGYTAVAEFAERAGDGLLLRSGSNSGERTGS
ncbi:hypothetical protein ACWD0J_36105 [Streptomyces sp. NPDC003011]